MFTKFNWNDFISAFVILFAIIDITGSVPVLVNIKRKGKTIFPARATIFSFLIFISFFYGGHAFLNLFGVDISSFAVAGSMIIFVVALEMILDIEIFKNTDSAFKDATIVPVVFPLIAGSGSLTTLLSIKSQYADINILLAVFVNLIFVYFILKNTKRIEHAIGLGGVYILQKLFGIILLAISVKLFTTSVASLIKTLGV